MAKFLALLLATAAAFGYVQAQCTPNAVLCGTTIMNVEQCADESTLVFLTPQGNPAINCAFHTNSAGEPQARGAFCCAEGRCSQQGDNAICD